MKSKLALLLLPTILLISGCSDGYRYPCQDPDNWDKKLCQKPYCSANGTCPEDLTHYEKPGKSQPAIPATQKPATGGCK